MKPLQELFWSRRYLIWRVEQPLEMESIKLTRHSAKRSTNERVVAGRACEVVAFADGEVREEVMPVQFDDE